MKDPEEMRKQLEAMVRNIDEAVGGMETSLAHGLAAIAELRSSRMAVVKAIAALEHAQPRRFD